MLRVLAVGVAVVVASPAPVSLAALNPAAKESQPTVYVLGDSLHDPDLGPRSTHPYLAKRLAKLGLAYEVHAKGEQGIAWGLDQVRLHPPPAGAIVVVALGTNDVHDPKGFRSTYKKLMTELADHEVLWVNLHISAAYRPAYGLDRPLNALLDRQALKRENLHVLDWHRYRKRHGITSTDGLHYSNEDYRLRARFIAAGIERRLIPDVPDVSIG